ncbi:MAG: translation elongation factor Ts [Pelovirga sp.]
MSITAAMVSELRKATSAGMMDCKKALIETEGNMEEAIDFLRKKGLSAAAKKSGRVASEGIVAAASDGSVGAIVEVNAETDFVAKNEAFQNFVNDVRDIVLANPVADVEALGSLDYPGTGRTVAEELTHQIATIGENMSIRRLERFDAGEGVVSSYVHGAGKIGVLVELKTAVQDDRVAELGKQIAMHIAAASPQYLNRDAVPTEIVDKEKEIMRVKALESGKPENIVEKIITGQINKYFGDVCLIEQAFVIDPDQTVQKVIDTCSRDLDTPVVLSRYVRYQLGEGIEKKEDDFAAEVAAMSK